MLGNCDLWTNCFYFVSVIITFNTAIFVFILGQSITDRNHEASKYHKIISQDNTTLLSNFLTHFDSESVLSHTHS